MNNNLIEKTKGDYKGVVCIDENPTDPRNDSNLGIMLCFHTRYNLGDKTEEQTTDFESWKEVREHIATKLNAYEGVILPLFLYDHSGLSIKVGSFDGLLPQGHARFDSGQVGYIYTTKIQLDEIGIKKKDRTKENITKILNQEVETYCKYLSGDIYGYQITKSVQCDKCEHTKEEHIDSCWGFYGYDHAVGEMERVLKEQKNSKK